MFISDEQNRDSITIISDGELYQSLLRALPLIASVTGGYATITNRQGVRLVTVDSEGVEQTDLVGKRFQAINNISQPCVAGSDLMLEAQSWVLPIGPYAIACSNIERIQRENHFFQAMQQALPVISKLVGGESILFDKNGRRLTIYTYEGKPRTDTLGKVSPAAAEAMRTQRPTVGSSMSVAGAVAVRFPVTKDFGFGFNNVHSVKRESQLLDEVRKKTTTRYCFIDIIGESPALVEAKKLARKLAVGSSSILICGETGTGKELFAQSIHSESGISQNPFIAINCGALPASLIESYLFGYEHGAFTGGKKGGDSGAFENAQGGTLFFDEISEMDLSLQSKILRALQEREIVRIGGSKPIPVNIRVLAAANRNLWDMVQKGEFRADLYYRLNIVELVIPPLRERLTDILDLVNFFIKNNNRLFSNYVLSISDEAMAILMDHKWPGNVRELQNCIEYAFNVMQQHDQQILPEHLPNYLSGDSSLTSPVAELAPLSTEHSHISVHANLNDVVARAEREHISAVLEHNKYSRQKTAQILKISLPTLWRKIKELNIPAR